MAPNLKVQQITANNRFTSSCALVVGRVTTGDQFLSASRMAPMSSYVIMGQEDMGVQFRRPAFLLDDIVPKLRLELMCQGKVIYRNFWNPTENRFTIPLDNPIGLCSNAKLAMKGKQFVVAAFGASPYIIFQRPSFGGIDANIMEILAEKFQFTFRFTIPRGYGTYSNGSWTGLVGMVGTCHTIVRI